MLSYTPQVITKKKEMLKICRYVYVCAPKVVQYRAEHFTNAISVKFSYNAICEEAFKYGDGCQL